MNRGRPLLTIEVVEKLEAALTLLNDVLEDRPELEALDLAHLIRQVREALSAISGEGADLPLNLLMVKFGWTAGQKFHFLARKEKNGAKVLADQDLPEGLELPLPPRLRNADAEACLSLEARIKKTGRNFSWISHVSRF